MKRWIAWLLLASMLLLAACTETPTETSDASSSAETSSETSGDVQQEYKHTVISVGKTYTASSAGAERYEDQYGQQLTDGLKAYDVGVHYLDVHMVGYNQNTRFDIDLGEDGKRITGMAVRSLEMYTDGVRLASSVRFYGSNDGKTGWKTIGRAFFAPTGDNDVVTASFYTDEPVDYRYIRASVNLSDGAAFFFIDEIEVYADAEEKEVIHAGETVYNNETVAQDEWKGLSTGVEAKPVDSKNVAAGAKYTFENCVFDERAPQNDTALTDESRTGRIFLENYVKTTTPVFVGVKAEGKPTVSLTLSKTYDNIYSVRVHMLGRGFRVSYPGAIDVYGSDDGKEYTFLGRMYAPAACDSYAYTLLLPEYIKAKYFRFELTGGSDNYWIEEIEVMTGYGEEQPDEHFPELNFPIVTEDEYWDSSESDYTEYQNLLLGLTQQIAATDYVAAENPQLSHELSPWDYPVLTDGKAAANMNCYSGDWFFFHGGLTLDFFYDLGKLSTVDKVTISLLEQKEWGISRPKFMSVLLSDDGENWYRVVNYERESDVSYNNDATRLTFEYELETAYAARFVRFRIENSGFLFIDEFEAYGTKEVKADAVRLKDTDLRHSVYYTNPERAQYASVDNTDVKADEIALLWDGNEGADNMLMGFAAYLDEEGNIKDTMMNGFLYFPGNNLPSGVHGYEASIKADWDYMFESTFDGKNGLEKLEEVVGEIKDTLNLPDYKVQVYFSLLRICDFTMGPNNIKDFGDVDGDGVTEDMTVSADRIKVFDWYIERVQTEFASRGYENIELDGFCWVNEDVGYEIDDSHIMTEAGDCVNAAGTNLLWIPYYTANRYHLGHEMEIDITNMQPNYMFDLEQPEYKLAVTASRTKWMKMCIEIEHNREAFSNPLYLRNYMLYLYYGATEGYMDSIHIYYDNLENISLLAYSDDPMMRFQYDATYHFIKGDLDVTPDTRDTVNLTVSKDTATTGTIGIEGEFALYTLTGATANGHIALSSDGSFIYYPEKGFTGIDSFTYTYNNYLGESETCSVVITVK